MDELLFLNKADFEAFSEPKENCLSLEMLTLKEHEDWVIVKEKTLKEENLENGFIKYDLQDEI